MLKSEVSGLRSGWSIIACAVCALSISPGLCDTVTEEMRQSDVRLLTPVTVAFQRISIGELLEHLTQKTGVSIEATSQDRATDPEVAVFVTRVTLADLMDAL